MPSNATEAHADRADLVTSFLKAPEVRYMDSHRANQLVKKGFASFLRNLGASIEGLEL